jgi:hypothetical protein
MSNRIFKLIKDEADERDFKFSFPGDGEIAVPQPMPVGTRSVVKGAIARPPTLPPTFDLRTGRIKVPLVLDQGPIGACGPNEISNALRFCLSSQRLADFQPSRLFIYFFARLVDGSPVTEDTGISIRGGLKSIQRFGAPDEVLCPYVPPNFNKQPSKAAVLAARQHVNSFQYLAVAQNIIYIKQALAVGFPIILGVQVYESMEGKQTTSTGKITVPDIKKEKCFGGHCVSLWGWDDKEQVFIMMNTWGRSVGKDGWFTIPYAYVLDPRLAFDLWTIRYWK